MHTRLKQSLALLTMLGLTACGGGTSSSTPPVVPPQTGTAVLAQIVGLGDSLTAGYQAGGLLGVPTSNPASTFPNALCGGGAGTGCVPAGQENGFWSDLYQLAKGIPVTAMYNPATSPLPLINPPGLAAQLIPLAPPNLIGPSHSSCDAFNQSAFQLSTAVQTRANPTVTPLDVAVPGMTMHEALYMNGPIAPTCLPLTDGSPLDQLQPIVAGESVMFYPVLQNFASLGSNLTEVNAAVSLKPTLTTVWLGANDILKYAFSGAQAPVDTPAQMQTDLTQIIKTLQNAGSRVVVANLPDVLTTPQFTKGGAVLAATLQAPQLGGIPAAYANAAATYVQSTYGVSIAGVVTENGLIKIVGTIGAVLAAGGPPSAVKPALNPYGDFFTDGFTAQVSGLNAAYNASIGAAATATGAPLVNIQGLFSQIANPATNPYAALYPPRGCCNLTLFGGLLSFDGLHPSNAGYAIIANAFVNAINSAYGTSIPTYTNAQLATIAAKDPY